VAQPNPSEVRESNEDHLYGFRIAIWRSVSDSDLHSSPNIVRLIKSRRILMGLVVDIAGGKEAQGV